MRDFYVTLLSNSSMTYFPLNTTANFCTQLPKIIHLDGEWEVALTELQFPCSLTTVNEGENIIYVKSNIASGEYVMKKTKIEAGNYTKLEDLVTALNANSLLINKVVFTMNRTSQKIGIAIQDKSMIELKMSAKLCLQLGFPPDTNLCDVRESRHPANVLLGLPFQLMIYCDIIEPQIIADVFARVLRIAVIENRRYLYGTQQIQMFSPPHYVPVLKREFESIETDIRAPTGERVPFLFGTVSIKLHFKKIK